jgi:hypothetical protein
MIFSKIFPTVSKFDNKKFLILMIVVMITVMIDSQIGYVADFIPNQLSSIWGIGVFLCVVVVFAISQYFILSFLKEIKKESKTRVHHVDKMYIIVSIAQYILTALLVFVILQILTSQQYSLITLYVSHVISYGIWIITLGLLARGFLLWFRRSNQNIMILLLTLAMIAYVLNGFSLLANYLNILMQQNQVVLSTDVAYFPEFSISSLGSQINLINQIASGIAYVLSWIGTVKLLYPYIQKLGKIKFWSIMSTAMIYYLVNFPLFVLGYFSPSENIDAMTNILIFSLGGIFTGIIFGAAFLSVARTLNKKSILRNHMIIAAYGFILFYTAGSAMAAQAAYPPFGLVSVSLTGLSCYLIYSGLYSSAVIVSQDSNLRQSIKKIATEQSKLLDSIGTAHMQQELESRVLTIAKKKSYLMEEETGIEPSMTENEIKDYIEMVTNEIHKARF